MRTGLDGRSDFAAETYAPRLVKANLASRVGTLSLGEKAPGVLL